MNATIITDEKATQEKVNYAKGCFKRIYEIDDAIYYFTVHPEYCTDEEGLDLTGNVFIVLLHPGGFTKFTMSFNETENSWKTDDQFVQNFVPSHILDMISDNICK